MSSSRRINLPLLPSLDAAQRPTLERARKQLGGAGETTGFAGTVVRVPNRDDTWSVGVALFASAAEVDVARRSAGAPPASTRCKPSRGPRLLARPGHRRRAGLRGDVRRRRGPLARGRRTPARAP
ncbi:MAG: hypothetical protein U0325_18450 [Polyangiales bacterium]